MSVTYRCQSESCSGWIMTQSPCSSIVCSKTKGGLNHELMSIGACSRTHGPALTSINRFVFGNGIHLELNDKDIKDP